MTDAASDLPGYQVIWSPGAVRGVAVRSAHFGQQILGGLRTLISGKIDEYLEVAKPQGRLDAHVAARRREGREGGLERYGNV